MKKEFEEFVNHLSGLFGPGGFRGPPSESRAPVGPCFVTMKLTELPEPLSLNGRGSEGYCSYGALRHRISVGARKIPPRFSRRSFERTPCLNVHRSLPGFPIWN